MATPLDPANAVYMLAEPAALDTHDSEGARTQSALTMAIDHAEHDSSRPFDVTGDA